jgi:flagellar hook capping protein FlgD
MRLSREKVWFGNFEDEGCSMWNINSDDEWLDDTESYRGLRSLRLRRYPNSGDNVVTNLERRIKKYSAESYTLHGYIKTLNSVEATIQIRYYNYRTGGTLIGQEDVGILVDGDLDWTFFSQELEIPDGCNYFDIRASSDCPDNGESFAWFDDVGLIAWEEWQPLQLDTQLVNPNDYYYLQLRADNYCTDATITYLETSLEPGPVTGSGDNNIPSNPSFILKQNYPNPFTGSKIDRNSGTRIDFELLHDKKVDLEIYNIRGQLVRSLLNEDLIKGEYSVVWNGTDNNNRQTGSGIYFYKIKVGKQETARKMVLIK